MAGTCSNAEDALVEVEIVGEHLYQVLDTGMVDASHRLDVCFSDKCVHRNIQRHHGNRKFGRQNDFGSFRITLGRATDDDALFVETVADTIAWDVTASLSSAHSEGTHAADPVDPQTAHNELWRHIEQELLLRRTGPQSLDVVVEREAEAAAAELRVIHAA